MIINKNNSVVERNGVTQEGNFTIKASAKAFKILSSSLYQNKVLAIVRELSCNAYDSHIAAGKRNEPIHIHLPNEVEPYFAVRDYGVGLSHKDIMTLYTTYFESTKTESNDFIGALGLGSKSPFSYTDSFTVTSYFNGEIKVYNAFLNEQEVPSIALLLQDKTDEINGIEVKISVKSNNFYEFKNEALKFFTYFHPTPKILGIDPAYINDIKKPEYIIEGTGWGLKRYNGGSIAAIQGNVKYTVPDKYCSSFKHFGTEKELLNSPLDLYFDIGSLDVAASRETLSLDNRTIQNIQDKLLLVKKELGEHIVKNLIREKSLYYACLKYNEIKGILSNANELIPEDHKHNFIKFINQNGSYFKINLGDLPISKISNITEYKQKNRPTIYGKSDGASKIYTTRADKNNIFIINDLPRGLNTRIKYNFKVYCNYVIIKSSSNTDKKLLLNKLGNPDYILASSLPKPPKQIRNKEETYKFSFATNEVDKGDFGVDWDEGGVYIIRQVRSLYKISSDNFKSPVSYSDFARTIKLAKNIGLVDDTLEVHALTESFVEKLENKDEWIDIFTFLKTEFFKKIKSEKIWRDLLISTESLNTFQNNYNYESRNSWTSQLTDINHPSFKRFEEVYKNARTLSKLDRTQEFTLGSIRSFMLALGLKFVDIIPDLSGDNDSNILEFINDMEKKYPLLKSLYHDIYGRKLSMAGVLEYVNLVDNSKK